MPVCQITDPYAEVIANSDLLQVVQVKDGLITYLDSLPGNCGDPSGLSLAAAALNDYLRREVPAGYQAMRLTAGQVEGIGFSKPGIGRSWLKYLMPNASRSASRNGKSVIVLKCCDIHRATVSWSLDDPLWRLDIRL